MSISNTWKTFYGILLVAVLLSTASCSDSDTPLQTDNVLKPGYPEGYHNMDSASVKVYSGDTITWAKYYQKLGNVSWLSSSMKFLITSHCNFESNLASQEADSIAALHHVSENLSSSYGVQYYKYSYQSVDENGQPKTLSGLLAFSYNSLEKSTPKNVLLYGHITICSNAESPSELRNASTFLSDVGIILKHARNNQEEDKNALIIMPDLEGYGVSKADTHPFMNNTLLSRQMVDGMRAGLIAFNKIDHANSLAEDWKSVAFGYSQGGSLSMGVHRFIEENKLTSELHFGGSVCGGGLYDIYATVKEYIANNSLENPYLIAMILNGMVTTDNTLENYGIESFLSSDYIGCGVIESIASKNYNSTQINDQVKNYNDRHNNCFNYADNLYSLDNIYSAQLFDYIKNHDLDAINTAGEENAYSSLYKAFKENNLLEGWNPQNRMFLFHSSHDKTVPYLNLELAKSAFQNNNQVKTMSYSSSLLSSHVETGFLFFATHEDNLIKAVLSDAEWSAYP